MNKEKDILTKVLQDRLKDYELPVEDKNAVWESIENDLNKPQVKSYWLWKRIMILSAAAVIAMLLCLNLFFKKGNEFSHPDSSLIIVDNQNITNEEANQVPVDSQEHGKSINIENSGTKVKKKDVYIEVVEDKESTQITPDMQVPDKLEETTTRPSAEQKEPNTKIYTYPKKKRRDKNFALALSVGNSGNTSSGMERTDYVVNTAYAGADVSKVGVESQLSKIVTNTKYDIPVSAGFSVRKYFTDSWALESGLVYTYLSSVETLSTGTPNLNGNEIFSGKKNIKMHYLGVPLKVVYSFYHTNRFSLYSTTGGMGELCVYGQESEAGQSSRLDIPEIQWSVFASLGLNYKFINKLGLFLEPGVVYYFDDGSEVNTIRKSIPFNINLQAGLRLTY